MIRFCGEDVSPAQQGTCPVAKKAVFKNCASNQSVIGLANANFGLESLSELPVNETLVSVRVLLGADTAESIEEHDLAAVIDQKRNGPPFKSGISGIFGCTTCDSICAGDANVPVLPMQTGR